MKEVSRHGPFSKIFIEGSALICRFTIDPAKRTEFLHAFNDLWTSHIQVMEENCNFVYYGFGRAENELYCVESWKTEESTNAG